jgi:hypothetical protein
VQVSHDISVGRYGSFIDTEGWVYVTGFSDIWTDQQRAGMQIKIDAPDLGSMTSAVMAWAPPLLVSDEWIWMVWDAASLPMILTAFSDNVDLLPPGAYDQFSLSDFAFSTLNVIRVSGLANA